MSQLIKPQIKWTPEKIQLLKDEYPSGDKSKLAERLGIKRSTLKDAAKRFKVKCLLRPNGHPPRGHKAKELLNDTLESYYWHGFIMADGHITNKGGILITLAEKDKEQLENLKLFLNVDQPIVHKIYSTTYSEATKSVHLALFDVGTCNKLREKYNVTNNKTTNPPNLDSLQNQEKFMSFFIGFFDGDGCFGRDYKNKVSMMKIECHGSWYSTLESMGIKLKELFDIGSTLKMTKRGHACFRIYKKSNFIKLKNFIHDNNIPAMKRKWDGVI